MNLDKIRKIIKSYIGKECRFIYKGSRNQNEEFDGIIVKCFPSIFLIKTINGTFKSFSYNDFVIRNIRIINK